ncbi:MAG: AAA family ATPase [Candidatus Parabeggiatoa sp.]|nr:AAA family ATPase [Candidatus Parabeggiatoa sp.]
MKIISLDIEGFRSMKQVHWKPTNLNVIIGPNGAGKSNLLRFLELMTISAQGTLGKYIQSLGGMAPLVWDGQATRLACQLKMVPFDQENGAQDTLLTYDLVLARLGQSSAYRIEQEGLTKYEGLEKGPETEAVTVLKRTHHEAMIFDDKEKTLKTLEEPFSEEESLLSIAATPFFANRFMTHCQRQLISSSIYHDVPVDRLAPLRQPVVTRAERRVDPDGQNLISVLHTLYTEDRDFRYELDAAMRAAFGNEFDSLMFPPAADQRTQLRVIWKSLQRGQSTAELSDGTLRFLFLLTVLAAPAPFTAIDEPELGLHPSMLPIIAEYAVSAAEQAQIVLTTHSPQLLDAFTDIQPSITVALCEQGETQLKNLSGEALAYWLENYSLGRLFHSGELEDL